MENIIQEAEVKMKDAIKVMESRFTNVRAGRANPNILDGVMVNYYGVDTPLNQLATISIPEARQLSIKPYDINSLGAIEKAIYESNVGLTPNNTGELIILNIPVLTEETRKNYVKQVRNIAEEGRIILRNVRQDANNIIKKLDNSEDDIKTSLDNIQKLTDTYNNKIDEILKLKEKELMTI